MHLQANAHERTDEYRRYPLKPYPVAVDRHKTARRAVAAVTRLLAAVVALRWEFPSSR
jgi:hypothetical protein